MKDFFVNVADNTRTSGWNLIIITAEDKNGLIVSWLFLTSYRLVTIDFNWLLSPWCPTFFCFDVIIDKEFK